MPQPLELDPDDPVALLGAIAGLPGAPALLDAVRKTGAPAHLVGGAPRDLLIGRRPRELDVVVEGDPGPLLGALGGAQTRHERFGTATVELADGALIDVARSRAEIYREPGALPEVEWAPLLIDLHRRDVTINAIAIDLHSGELTAAPIALDDLAAMRLRVLHPASFTDDPTRLWRLVRYEVRLGADWEPVTAQLARVAVDSRVLDCVTPARIASEVRLGLAEPDAYGVFAAAARLGLPPRMDLDADRLWEAARLAGDEADAADVVLAALCSADPLLVELLDRRDERSLIDAALMLRAEGGDAPSGRPGPLGQDAPGSFIVHRFGGLPVAAIAAAPDRDAARRYLRELRGVKPVIGGEDLVAAGVPRGPLVGRGLEAARDAVLDGRVGPADRATQLELALAAAC